MDEQLAAIYGTGQSEDDIEKTAAAELLVKLAEENGVDLNQLSDNDVAELLTEIQKTAEENEESSSPEDEGQDEESSEKVAEADFLGRVMAHSMVQELNNIEKVARENMDPGLRPESKRHFPALRTNDPNTAEKAKNVRVDDSGRWMREGKRRGKALLSQVGDAFKATQFRKGRADEALVRKRVSDLAKTEAGQKYLQGEHALGGTRAEHYKKLQSAAKASKYRGLAKSVGAYGGAATLAAGLGYGVKKALEKKSSVDLDQIAAERAYEMAKQAGWVDHEGDLIDPGVKEASAEEYVERRALELLEENGYPVQWND